MAYVKSNKIKVFPATGRAAEYPESFLLSEDNLNRYLCSIYKYNNSSFIVNDDFPDVVDAEHPLKLVLSGYYFEISSLPSELQNTDTLWATVYLLPTLQEGSYRRLSSPNYEQEGCLDYNEDFKGLTLSENEPENEADYDRISLQIKAGGEILETAKFKYSTNEIADSAITTAKIADANITTSKIEDSAVTTAKIADLNVTTVKLNDAAVTEAKINNSAVTTDKINSGAVTTAKIDDSAVTTVKIADRNITTDKIADGNVTTAKIGSNAVTEDKIADGNVTTAKLGSGAVVEGKIADGAVTTDKIGSSAVTTDKIADKAITNDKIAYKAVTNDKLEKNSIGIGSNIYVPLGGTIQPGSPLLYGLVKVDDAWYANSTNTVQSRVIKLGLDSKANSSDLGDQVKFSYSGGTLTITKK